MRMPPGVEEDQVSRARPNDRAISLHCGDARRGRVVRENEVAAYPVVRAEEQAGQRVGVHMALEPHRGSPLNVEDNAVAVVVGGLDALRAG